LPRSGVVPERLKISVATGIMSRIIVGEPAPTAWNLAGAAGSLVRLSPAIAASSGLVASFPSGGES
jgi:hypothetical protein